MTDWLKARKIIEEIASMNLQPDTYVRVIITYRLKSLEIGAPDLPSREREIYADLSFVKQNISTGELSSILSRAFHEQTGISWYGFTNVTFDLDSRLSKQEFEQFLADRKRQIASING